MSTGDFGAAVRIETVVPVRRDELLDLQAYERARADFRRRVLAEKRRRRIHLPPELTFLFENRLTVRYQVQEMLRAERILKEEEVRFELATYNELLARPGSLACTLLIEIPDPELRDRRLRELLGLPERLYARLEDGTLVRPRYDPRQVGEERLSSVQYLKFDTGGCVPVALGADHPRLAGEVALDADQRAALAEDLEEGRGPQV